MQDSTIQHRISELVNEEHRLRSAVQAGTVGSDEERARLGHLEEQLDQCWDLLRRRRAARSNHEDPDGVQARSIEEVEHYQQ
jgi:hypothetical protein